MNALMYGQRVAVSKSLLALAAFVGLLARVGESVAMQSRVIREAPVTVDASVRPRAGMSPLMLR